MSMSNSFSKAMTSSTVSRLSAPRSSMKLASLVSFSRSTPSSSTMMSFTLSSTLLMSSSVGSYVPPYVFDDRPSHDHAAVHHQHLAGDVPGQIGGEKQRDAGHILRPAEPSQRDALS